MTDVVVNETSVEFYVKNNGLHPSEANEEQRKSEYWRLRDVAANRNMNPGWAYHAWCETFGTTDLPEAWKDEYTPPETIKLPVFDDESSVEEAMKFLNVKPGTSIAEITTAGKNLSDKAWQAVEVLLN